MCNRIRSFSRHEQAVFAGMWSSIRQHAAYTDALCAFYTQIGSQYQCEGDRISGILVGGRATNGWDGSHPGDRGQLFPDCRSAFVEVSRLIAEHFFPCDRPEDHLVWTNSAHISYVDSGNPSKALWEAQFDGSCKISLLEQEKLCPEVSIYITGTADDWDSPVWDGYLNNHGCSEPIAEDCITNDAGDVCRMLAYECEGRLFIFTDRPECFSRNAFCNAVIGIIENWKNKE